MTKIIKKRARRKNKLVPNKRIIKDMDFWKPEQFKDYVTISELAMMVERDISWLRLLERLDRIPRASRVQRGQLSIRLWSPAQVEEIKIVLSKMKIGRPRK